MFFLLCDERRRGGCTFDYCWFVVVVGVQENCVLTHIAYEKGTVDLSEIEFPRFLSFNSRDWRSEWERIARKVEYLVVFGGFRMRLFLVSNGENRHMSGDDDVGHGVESSSSSTGTTTAITGTGTGVITGTTDLLECHEFRLWKNGLMETGKRMVSSRESVNHHHHHFAGNGLDEGDECRNVCLHSLGISFLQSATQMDMKFRMNQVFMIPCTRIRVPDCLSCAMVAKFVERLEFACDDCVRQTLLSLEDGRGNVVTYRILAIDSLKNVSSSLMDLEECVTRKRRREAGNDG